MGRARRDQMRRLQLALTILAMVGMVTNVICNPFSPSQVLRWILCFSTQEADSNGPPSLDSAVRASSVDDAHRGWQPGSPKKHRSSLDVPADVDDVVVVPAKLRSTLTPLINGASANLAIAPGLFGGAQVTHFHNPHPASALPQLCRFRC